MRTWDRPENNRESVSIVYPRFPEALKRTTFTSRDSPTTGLPQAHIGSITTKLTAEARILDPLVASCCGCSDDGPSIQSRNTSSLNLSQPLFVVVIVDGARRAPGNDCVAFFERCLVGELKVVDDSDDRYVITHDRLGLHQTCDPGKRYLQSGSLGTSDIQSSVGAMIDARAMRDALVTAVCPTQDARDLAAG